MVKYSGTRAKAARTTWTWDITPTYTEEIVNAKRFSRDCGAKNCDVGLWQVTSGNRVLAVNLYERTCTCRKWDVTGIPCNHVVAAIINVEQNSED